MTVKYYSDLFHGIPFNLKVADSQKQSDVIPALKFLYNMTNDTFDRRYIGFVNDNPSVKMLGLAGFGDRIVDLTKMLDNPSPSNEEIISDNVYGTGDYTPCYMHNRLENGSKPLCALVKARFTADYFMRKENRRFKINIEK